MVHHLRKRVETFCQRWVHSSGATGDMLLRLRYGDSEYSGSRDPRSMEQEIIYRVAEEELRLKERGSKWNDDIG